MAFKHLADDKENEYHQSGCLQGERFSRVDREFDQKPGADVPKAKTRKVISHPETKVAPENVTQGCSRDQDSLGTGARGQVNSYWSSVTAGGFNLGSWISRGHRFLRVPEPFLPAMVKGFVSGHLFLGRASSGC